MERRRAPPTEEGWYVLHDFRRIDWAAWRDAPAHERRQAITEGIEYFAAAERVDDAEEGESATFSILGHEADLLTLHLRPTMADLDVLERGFEHTALTRFTEHVDSFVSVTEVSGYVSEAFFEDDGEVEDPGIANYIETRLRPRIPDAEYVNFYPMDKRRDAEFNWYDTPFEERADLMANHGEIGRKYAGRVTQLISSSVGLDDHEWGVTLFANDPVDIKDLLYEMRFDPSTSRYAEFGRFSVGRRFPPENLGAYLAGEAVPLEAGAGAENGPDGTESHHPHGHAVTPEESAGDAHGDEPADRGDDAHPIRETLSDLGVYAGSPHGEDVHAVVVYSAADLEELVDAVDGLSANFDHYDTHAGTTVYEPHGDGPLAVASLWETERAAETAAGFLADLPGVETLSDEDEDGWGTMGMFYTVVPDHREDFLETFETVGEMLSEMDGHRESTLLVNVDDENDMFIASHWDAREDALEFFRSDAFAETVEWGREVLADRPRHVFLA